MVGLGACVMLQRCGNVLQEVMTSGAKSREQYRALPPLLSTIFTFLYFVDVTNPLLYSGRRHSLMLFVFAQFIKHRTSERSARALNSSLDMILEMFYPQSARARCKLIMAVV